jgi:hypothetical protein
MDGKVVKVTTACHSSVDRLATSVILPLLREKRAGVKFRFPYPTEQHLDDACDWHSPDRHQTTIIEQGDCFAVLERNIDATTYFVKIAWEIPPRNTLVASGTL